MLITRSERVYELRWTNGWIESIEELAKSGKYGKKY